MRHEQITVYGHRNYSSILFFQDPYPKREVLLGTKDAGFTVREGVAPGYKSQQYCFTLKTPGRLFNLAPETRDDQLEWISKLKYVISQQMSSFDMSSMSRAF